MSCASDSDIILMTTQSARSKNWSNQPANSLSAELKACSQPHFCRRRCVSNSALADPAESLQYDRALSSIRPQAIAPEALHKGRYIVAPVTIQTARTRALRTENGVIDQISDSSIRYGNGRSKRANESDHCRIHGASRHAPIRL